MEEAMMRFKRWMRAWLYEAVPPGTLYQAAPRGIRNGADYAQPIIIPRSVTRAGADAVATFVESTNRDSFKFQFDTPQRSSADLPVVPVTEDPLEEWDAITREDVVSNCHTAYDRDPIAKAAVDLTTSFVVGDGMNLNYKNDRVEEVLEAFIDSDDTPVRTYERDLLRDLQIDGELMLRFYAEAGETVMVPLRPWEIAEIEVRDGFIRRPERYLYRHEGREEWIPADEVLHVAINRRSYELRGKPDLYVMLPWLRAYKEWLEDRARQNYWRGALLFHVQVDTASAATLSAVAARYATPPTPGSVAVTSAKEAITPITNSVAAGEVAEDGRQIKLMAAVGKKLPEYMLSDGENANLASTNNQELPVLTQFAEYQRVMSNDVWARVFRRVLQAAIDAGVLPAEVPQQDSEGNATGEMVDTLHAFEVQYEPLTQDDPLNIAQKLQVAFDNEWVSAQTAATELGYDYQIEQRQINDEREADRNLIAQGLKVAPPGVGPDGKPVAPDEQMPDEREEEGIVSKMGRESQANGNKGTMKDAPDNLDSVNGLNGAQIAAALEILSGVANGTTPTTVAIELLMTLGISEERATRMVNDTAHNAASIRKAEGVKQQGQVSNHEP